MPRKAPMGNSRVRSIVAPGKFSSFVVRRRRARACPITQVVYWPFHMVLNIGPSDFVPWLTDRKWAYIRIEGTSFGNLPLNCELKLEVWDSPNSAGVVIDAIRCAKLALDRRIGGALIGPSSYFMKSPPEQFTDYEARARTEVFIRGEPEGSAKRSARPTE